MKKAIALILLTALLLALAAGSYIHAEDAAVTPAIGNTAEPVMTALPEASDGPELSAASPEEMLAQWYRLGAMLRENGNYPFVKLERGDRGYEVVALQERLAQLNFYSKAVLPVFGNGTYTAMRRFETVNGLKVNGIASIEDQILLFGPDAQPESGTTIRPVTLTPAPVAPTQGVTQTRAPEITAMPTEDEATLMPEDSATPDITTAPTPDNG